jgi:hypothetical protein
VYRAINKIKDGFKDCRPSEACQVIFSYKDADEDALGSRNKVRRNALRGIHLTPCYMSAARFHVRMAKIKMAK